MKLHFIVLTSDQDYPCDAGCGWTIQPGERYVSIVHGDHRDNICLKCEELRQSKIPLDAEIVA